MREPFELVHHNRYRVSFSPEATPEGTFLARVLVSWIDDDGAVLDHRLRHELPPFPTAVEAASVAKDAALRWLDALEAERAALTAYTPQDRSAYVEAQREWRAAADAFEGSMQRALEHPDPLDATQVAVDAAVLKRLHERWLETAVHLAVVRRR